MDNAGRLSAQFFVENIKNPFNQTVLVLAGKGDNGGDAIIMHHYLLEYGIKSKLFPINSKNNKIIDKYRISKRYRINQLSKESADSYDWFIDGIFGIGLKHLNRM